jgi:hypothetical protein
MSYDLVNRFKGPSTLMVIDQNLTLNLSQLSVAVTRGGIANANCENVTTAIITSCKWSTASPTGQIKIARDAGGLGTGANVVANLTGQGQWIHNEVPFANTPTGNIQVTITGGGTIYMTIKKEAVYNVQTQDI